MKLINIEKEISTPGNNKIQLYKTIESQRKLSSTVLLIGMFHGDEPEGEFLLKNLMRDLQENPHLMGNNTALFIPCLNPDGKQKKSRLNINGVDLNRNFPTKNWVSQEEDGKYYGGNKAASEVETCFVIDIMEEYKPARVLTIHSPYQVINYDGPADNLAENMSKLNGYPVEFDIGYPTPGSFGTYAGKERNIPTITLELPPNRSMDEIWTVNKKALYYFVSL